jgi:small subunit ribosomal protein S14
MARLSVINREKKREFLVKKFAQKRSDLLAGLRQNGIDGDEHFSLMKKLSSLPRDSSPSRRRSRCVMTGRPRAVYNQFGLCGNQVRSLSMSGVIPGVIKASW